MLAIKEILSFGGRLPLRPSFRIAPAEKSFVNWTDFLLQMSRALEKIASFKKKFKEKRKSLSETPKMVVQQKATSEEPYPQQAAQLLLKESRGIFNKGMRSKMIQKNTNTRSSQWDLVMEERLEVPKKSNPPKKRPDVSPLSKGKPIKVSLPETPQSLKPKVTPKGSAKGIKPEDKVKAKLAAVPPVRKVKIRTQDRKLVTTTNIKLLSLKKNLQEIEQSVKETNTLALNLQKATSALLACTARMTEDYRRSEAGATLAVGFTGQEAGNGGHTWLDDVNVW